MNAKPYEYESVLQEMLADYPRLLAGDEISDDQPLRWLLVGRETNVPDSQGSSGRWSADHLFVDQDGVPTVVEVKRGDNTEVRRRIVGQMFDYVSHATLHWDAETLREQYAETCEERGIDPDEQLTELIREDDATGFWDTVEANLRSKQVRLLFVADEIPSELKRVVEFLNESMGDVDVFAVEVNQYVSGEDEAYVPRLYGQTEEARATSTTTSTSRTGDEYVESEAELYEDLEDKLTRDEITEDVYEAFVNLYEFSKELGDGLDIGGTKNAKFGLQVDAHQGEYGSDPNVFTANVTGKVKVWPAKFPLDEEASSSPVDWDPSVYAEFESGFQSLDGVGPDATNVDFEVITRADNRFQFENLVREFVAHCRQASE